MFVLFVFFFFFLVEKFNFALRTQAQNSIFFYLNLKNKNVQAETKLWEFVLKGWKRELLRSGE